MIGATGQKRRPLFVVEGQRLTSLGVLDLDIGVGALNSDTDGVEVTRSRGLELIVTVHRMYSYSEKGGIAIAIIQHAIVVDYMQTVLYVL